MAENLTLYEIIKQMTDGRLAGFFLLLQIFSKAESSAVYAKEMLHSCQSVDTLTGNALADDTRKSQSQKNGKERML